MGKAVNGLIRNDIIVGTTIPGDIGRVKSVLYNQLINPSSSSVCYIDSYANFSINNLSQNAINSMLVPNAGGKSDISEALSIDIFDNLGGMDFIFEEDVKYFYTYKKLDYLFTIRAKNGGGSVHCGDIPFYIRVGVSVTRAIGKFCGFINRKKIFDSNSYTQQDADQLLKKKMKGLIVARNCIDSKNSFYTAVLHIFCQIDKIAVMLKNSYDKMMRKGKLIDNDGSCNENSRSLESDGCNFIILITVCADDIIYTNVHQ